jgi:hypothetical protein
VSHLFGVLPFLAIWSKCLTSNHYVWIYRFS